MTDGLMGERMLTHCFSCTVSACLYDLGVLQMAGTKAFTFCSVKYFILRFLVMLAIFVAILKSDPMRVIIPQLLKVAKGNEPFSL